MVMHPKGADRMANSVDPDQTAQTKQSLFMPFANNSLSHVMRKSVYDICEQQRRRSAYASAQSDQHLCFSLPRGYNTCTCYIRNFKDLACFCS